MGRPAHERSERRATVFFLHAQVIARDAKAAARGRRFLRAVSKSTASAHIFVLDASSMVNQVHLA